MEKEYEGIKRLIEKANAYDALVEDIEKYENKIADDRLEYGYDSICLRIENMVNELAILKAEDKSSKHYKDIDYWHSYYGGRAVRIYDILDDLLDGKGHSKAKWN